MTREQVHDLMENELRCVQKGNYCDRDCAKCPLVKDDKELIEAYGYVIKALEQEPCEDCVSRADVETFLDKYNFVSYDYTVEDLVKALQPVTLQPKTGHWIYRKGYVPYKWKCDKCFASSATDFNYCPSCGAKMESEDKE